MVVNPRLLRPVNQRMRNWMSTGASKHKTRLSELIYWMDSGRFMSDNIPRAAPKRFFLRSPLVLIPILGLLYSAVFLAYLVVQSYDAGIVGFFPVSLLSLSAVLVLAVVGIRKRPRVGYVAAAVVSGLSLVILGAFGNVTSTLATPVDTRNFVFAVTVFPALFTTLLYSILGFRDLRQRASVPISSVPTVSRYTVWSILIVGFILGSLVIGLMAGATQSRLLSDLPQPADITIVSGAALPKNPNFYSPSEFAAHVGQTITWVNLDSTVHTVTSSANAFDSGRIDVGSRFQLTFTKAGDYDYYCVYHPWMNGEFIVT